MMNTLLSKLKDLFALKKKEESWEDFTKGLVKAFVVVFAFCTVAFQPFQVPTGSLVPTVLPGDFLIGSKYTYGYSAYSFPFVNWKLFDGRIMGKSPKRGDIVIFRYPKDTSVNFVKRLIGLPGDKIRMSGGVLFINGKECKLEKLPNHHYIDPRPSYQKPPVPQYTETFPDGFKHRIIKEHPFGMGNHDNTEEFIVPEKHYFMIGDNRDGSDDSRGNVGFVPEDNIMGRAEFVFFSTTARWWEIHKWLFGIRWNRIFTKIS